MARRNSATPKITSKSKKVADLYDYFGRTYIRHTDRDYYDKPFVLDPFQYDDIWKPIYGTLTKDGKRWYRRALIGLPRYTGKSELSGRIVITNMMMEPCPEGEYGIIATSKEQAQIVFGKVSAMIRLDPDLSAKFDVLRRAIVNKETRATLKVYPAEEAAVQGAHFVCCVADEVHVWKGTALYSAIVSGMKDENSLLVMITTAAKARSGALWDYILPNVLKDQRAYVCWKGAQSIEDQMAGKPFDPLDRRAWRRACVASWQSMDQMEDLFESMPLSDFIRYILNVFPPDDLVQDRAFRPFKVNRCIDKSPFEWSRGRLCAAIDGAVSGDRFAIVYGYLEKTDFHVYPIILGKSQAFRGKYYDLTAAELLLVEYQEEFYVDRTVIDPARMLMMAQHLVDKHGIPVEEYKQDGKNMGAASQFLESIIEDERLHVHGPASEELAVHLKNAVRDDAHAFGWRIGKPREESKIDGAIATAMCAITLDAMGSAPSFGIITI